jgi:hypothetical protein
MAANDDDIHKINERLKTLCPHNDNDQLETEITKTREQVLCEVFGPDHRETRRRIAQKIRDMVDRRDSLVARASATLATLPVCDASAYDTATGQVLEFFTDIVATKVQELEHALAALDRAIDDVRRERDSKMALVLQTLYSRLGVRDQTELNERRFGRLEDRAEVMSLKERRDFFLDDADDV